MRVWIGFCLGLLTANTYAQKIGIDSLSITITASTQQDIDKLASRIQRLAESLQRQSTHLLNRLQREEAKLEQEIEGLDSTVTKPANVVTGAYADWRLKLSSATIVVPPLREYIPHLDSLQTALRFLMISPGLSIEQLNSLENLSSKLTGLSDQLQQTRELGNFLFQRQAALEEQLRNVGLVGRLTSYKKQLYYYRDQVAGYKTLLNGPNRLSSVVLSLVRNQPAFQRYFQQHSYLAHLFCVPGSGGTTAGQGLPGLQTRGQVASIVEERLGKGASFSGAASNPGGNASGANPLSGSMQQAQSQLDQWKGEITKSGGGGSSDPVPDFTPNTQHNKSLWRRLQLGFNLQSAGSTALIPATSDLALTLGYKLSDKSIIGAGVAYKLGWGQPFEHIGLSGQGAGLRSYVQIKATAGIWLTGGFEYNYYNALTKFSQLKKLQAWQQSGLLGLTKKISSRGKTADVQLLYDVLRAQHVPQSQPLLFRVGYTFN